jgi:hypothetical protein
MPTFFWLYSNLVPPVIFSAPVLYKKRCHRLKSLFSCLNPLMAAISRTEWSTRPEGTPSASVQKRVAVSVHAARKVGPKVARPDRVETTEVIKILLVFCLFCSDALEFRKLRFLLFAIWANTRERYGSSTWFGFWEPTWQVGPRTLSAR